MAFTAWKKSPTIAVWVLLLALAIANALLIRQNLQMRTALSKYEPPVLQSGEQVQSFSAPSLSGENIQVNYTGNGPKRVLMFFTPDCPYCREQFAYWREVLTHADMNRFEILGVVTESEDKAKLNEYLRSVGCSPDSQKPLRTVLIPNNLRRSYKLSSTPITLVVANDGSVENVWYGRWDSESLAAAASIFGMDFSRAKSNSQPD
ncbi:MAG: AhpC/TSA family [Acidobacteriota bacterium]|jgi:peroxiredoxin|nr:AhpC/TSA family [Acidobacteriota bacterium]